MAMSTKAINGLSRVECPLFVSADLADAASTWRELAGNSPQQRLIGWTTNLS